MSPWEPLLIELRDAWRALSPQEMHAIFSAFHHPKLVDNAAAMKPWLLTALTEEAARRDGNGAGPAPFDAMTMPMIELAEYPIGAVALIEGTTSPAIEGWAFAVLRLAIVCIAVRLKTKEYAGRN